MTDATLPLAATAVPPPPRAPLQKMLMWGILLALLAASWKGADMRPVELVRSSGNIAQFVDGFFPPQITDWVDDLKELLVTFEIALWGTALAVLCSMPLALLASSNLTPWWIHQPVRRALDSFRAINEMVFALLFVSAVGLGPFAGVLALWVHTTGVLAKLFSEAVESIDRAPVEGVRATGASRLHEIIWGVIPQVAPHWTSYALYRFESNSRSATVLGLIGAGGIGQLLFETLNAFAYSQTAMIVLVIVAAVTLIDLLSQALRKRLI